MEEGQIKDREKHKLKNEKNLKNLLTDKKRFDILWPSNIFLEGLQMYIEFKDIVFHFIKNANDGKNSIIILQDGRLYGKLENVSSDWGNYWFKKVKEFYNSDSNNGEFITEYLFLDFSAFHNDYDSYSDTYKDYNNFRPHLTKEEWKEKVKRARERKP